MGFSSGPFALNQTASEQKNFNSFAVRFAVPGKAVSGLGLVMSLERKMGCSFMASQHVMAWGLLIYLFFLMECEAVNPSCWQTGRLWAAVEVRSDYSDGRDGKLPASCN